MQRSLLRLNSGNNDFAPDDQVPAQENDVYHNAYELWSQLGWLDDNAATKHSFEKCNYCFLFSIKKENYQFQTFRYHRRHSVITVDGYYEVRPIPGLVVMVLNTNFYYSGNRLFAHLPNDPGHQFAALKRVLRNAQADGLKVMAFISFNSILVASKIVEKPAVLKSV